MRETWTTDQLPPRGAGIERALSSDAMPFSVKMPGRFYRLDDWRDVGFQLPETEQLTL